MNRRYVDLQVNGYAGIDFNDDSISAEQLTRVCQQLSADGVEKILATVITAPIDAMSARIARLARMIDESAEIASMIVGIHVEGPFLNPRPGFAGAHPAEHMLEATMDRAQRLLDSGAGHVRLFTLAPEADREAGVTRALSDKGIVVAAGHTDADRGQLRDAIDGGLRLFTHLGNGCPNELARHDNIVQRVLSFSDEIMISFIADGHHVPMFALKNYLNCVPTDNVVIVTDAISAAGMGPGRHRLAGQWVEVDADGAAWAEGREHFAGCATTLNEMASKLETSLGVTETELERWMRDNPARLIAT